MTRAALERSKRYVRLHWKVHECSVCVRAQAGAPLSSVQRSAVLMTPLRWLVSVYRVWVAETERAVSRYRRSRGSHSAGSRHNGSRSRSSYTEAASQAKFCFLFSTASLHFVSHNASPMLFLLIGFRALLTRLHLAYFTPAPNTASFQANG